MASGTLLCSQEFIEFATPILENLGENEFLSLQKKRIALLAKNVALPPARLEIIQIAVRIWASNYVVSLLTIFFKKLVHDRR